MDFAAIEREGLDIETISKAGEDLACVEVAFAGRAYAAYGRVYLASAVMWLWIIEGKRPDAWDIGGAGMCIAGALMILLAPRG